MSGIDINFVGFFTYNPIYRRFNFFADFSLINVWSIDMNLYFNHNSIALSMNKVFVIRLIESYDY